jgi:acyl-CoA reductase-like NAD-dependent aldehyde dehydrogenase
MKPSSDARLIVERVRCFLKWHGERFDVLDAPHEPLANPMGWNGTKSRIRHEPKGVSLIIAPWNYPIGLLVGPLTSAIAAGCPAIIKPSEISEACSTVTARLIGETFAPEEIAVFEPRSRWRCSNCPLIIFSLPAAAR